MDLSWRHPPAGPQPLWQPFLLPFWLFPFHRLHPMRTGPLPLREKGKQLRVLHWENSLREKWFSSFALFGLLSVENSFPKGGNSSPKMEFFFLSRGNIATFSSIFLASLLHFSYTPRSCYLKSFSMRLFFQGTKQKKCNSQFCFPFESFRPINTASFQTCLLLNNWKQNKQIVVWANWTVNKSVLDCFYESLIRSPVHFVQYNSLHFSVKLFDFDFQVC